MRAFSVASTALRDGVVAETRTGPGNVDSGRSQNRLRQALDHGSRLITGSTGSGEDWQRMESDVVKTIRPMKRHFTQNDYIVGCVFWFLVAFVIWAVIRWLEQNGSTPIDDLPLSDQREFILIMLGGFFLAMWGFMRLVDWWNRLMR